MNRLAVICLLPLAAATLLAGTTGKIAGRVTDRNSGEALVSANVLVAGTQLGASTDVDGWFTIVNVPPGEVTLRVTMVGYARLVVQDVRVVADRTTDVNPVLVPSAVEMADIVVQAERPMVQRDLTATMSVVSSDQIALLPVRNFVEVIQLQAGVVGEGRTIHIRGGRSNEVAYLIDGMYVKDPVLGGLGTAINNDAIAELNLLSGTFNAEYGGALSGVVNIVTKEGGSSFSGNVEAQTSEFGIRRYADIRENRVSATLGGPVTGEGFTFFASGERDARGSWLPYGYDRTESVIGKLSARPLAEIKTVLTGRYAQNARQNYSHDWKYIPDQYLRIREYSRQAILTLTHTVSPSMFYDIRLSYFNQSYYSGIEKDTALYLPTTSSEFFPIGSGFEFYSRADPVEVFDNRTETYDLKGDMVWQIGRANEVKLGVQLKRYRLDYFNVYDPKRNFPYVTRFTKNPVEGAAYLQDKIELESLVINLGLRFDYLNQRAPFRSIPLDPASIVESTPKAQWSPRLGVAHPISDRTSLHFSYGHFFQIPTYDRFYENAQYDINVREPLFGQPDLDAMREVQYEVGITHQFSATIAGSFTASYKDVTGLIGTQYYAPFVDGRFVGYTLYVNDDYANIKGFEVSLTMRRTGFVAGSLSYTYQSAKGSASSETEDYPGTTKSTLLYPLNWDKTHILNLNVSLLFSGNEGPEIFGIAPLENTVWNFILRAGSGYPYTPSGRDVGFVEKNSARLPATYSLDMEVSKDWPIGRTTLSLFAEVLNLTDHRNVVSVYTDTGEPDVTTIGNYSQEYIRDPSNFGPPRRIRLGARFRF